jgi:MFS family permease
MLSVKSAKSSEHKLFYGYIVVLSAFIIQIAMLGPRASYGVFFKPVIYDLNWTRALTSGAYSLSVLMQGISGVMMGSLNDRLGPRRVMTLCGTLIGAGVMLMSTVYYPWQLYLFYAVIVGIGMGGLVAPPFSSVARWFVKRRIMMTGIVVAGGGASMLVMPLLSDRLIAMGWRHAYVILGAIVMVFTVLAAQFLKRDPSEMGQVPFGESEPPARAPKMDTEGFSLQEAIHTGQFWMMLVMMLSFGAYSSTIIVHYVPFITDLGMSATTAAIIFSILGGSIIAGSVIMGTFANKVGNKLSSIVAFFILASALFSLLFAKELWMFYLLSFAFGLTYGGLTPLQSTLPAEMFGMKSHGLFVGICGFSLLTGAASGPFMAGYLFDQYGNYHLAFLILGIVATVGLMLAVLLRPPRRPSERH